ncbi:MAG: hypothetical protein ACJA0G_000319 [Kangiellaceae bacterium]|jgi:hypothetical protein
MAKLRRNDCFAKVISGLKKGELVITRPSNKVEQGVKLPNDRGTATNPTNKRFWLDECIAMNFDYAYKEAL